MTAAEVLRGHRMKDVHGPGGSDCTCGEWHYHWPDNVDHVAHQLAMLESAGYAVVKLAEPLHVDSDGEHYFTDGSVATEIHTHPGDGVVHQGGWEWTIDQAMEVGLQWISAAMVAGPNRTVTR